MLPDLKLIKKRRKALGLTQRELAVASHVSQSLIAKVERGSVVPNYDIARRIFTFLETVENHEDKKAKDVMHKGAITLQAGDKVSKAASLAKKYRISQFPVMDGKTVVGALRTKDLIDAEKSGKVNACAGEPFPTVSEDTPVNYIKPLLKHHSAVLVLKKNSIKGIITAEDFL